MTTSHRRIGLIVPALALLLALAVLVYAEPEGPSITPFGNSTKQTTAAAGPYNHTKGSINYINLNAESQNLRWKAYVGNVTGTFVLQDAGGFNIYSWPTGTTVSGEVYASRNGTINWASIGCATNASIATEQTHLGVTHQAIDSINRTFNSSAHSSMTIGTTSVSNCPTVYTYANGTAQPANDATNSFQEILLNSTTDALVYATHIDDNEYGYNTGFTDFQMIVPDKGSTLDVITVPYYFYIELS